MPITDVITHPETHSLVVIGEFAASAERLWQIWADPRQLERWWGPVTHPATVTTHDLTPGGIVNYYMTGPDGERFPGGWEILEVNPPHGFTARDFFADANGHKVESAPVSTMCVEITEADGTSRMVITSTFSSAEDLQTVADMGMEEGIRSAAGQIDTLLAA